MRFKLILLVRGYRIRRKAWGKYCYIEYDGNEIVTQCGNPISLNSALFEKDWEIVE